MPLHAATVRSVACRAMAVLLAAVVPAAPAAAADEAARMELGRRLFTQGAVPSCAVCHTLKDAGARGEVGPVLDEIKPNAKRVATALRDGVGAMPSFKATLSEEQIEVLSHYVAVATGAPK